MFVIDGQKIAKKVSLQIGAETKRLKALLEDYKACLPVDECPELTENEVFDPTIIEHKLQELGVWCDTITGERREAMDAFLMLQRSEEDLCMLREEAQNVVHYYSRRKSVIEKTIKEMKELNDDAFNKGMTALLHKQLEQDSQLMIEASQVCETMNKDDVIDEDLLSYDSDSSEDFDYDSD